MQLNSTQLNKSLLPNEQGISAVISNGNIGLLSNGVVRVEDHKGA
jgi:hypothetical protein